MCSVHGTGLRKRVRLQHLLPGIYLQNLLLPITLTGRVVTVSSITSFIVLNNCSSELQQKFRSETITEEELVGLMNKFVEDTKSGVHRKEGCPDMKVLTYGVSKMGITVLSRIHARKLSEQRRGDRILLNACCPRWVRTDMGGPTAIKSPEEGAETPIYLALLPSDAKGPHGEFVMENKVEQWGPPLSVPSMGPVMILP
ncbi:carbonyl reductase [NADPH] 1-like [Leopardus geoffroyi]|uniref:carbonyl reductase [NADPH] 1-like n=1 Tax=Leopardus geoffroyi TaxID=46844 RepID=UPI001E264C6E|nr:carbonyl reductase [NADPH] 1-like [Leopardus geoffroyi]